MMLNTNLRTMKLSQSKAQEIAEKPINGDAVLLGRKYESRLRLFTESKFEEEMKTESSWKEFTEFMQKAISTETEKRVTQFIQFPLSVVEITNSLMNDLYKVFNAGNSYFSTKTVEKNGGVKMQELLDRLKISSWIEEKGKEVLKNKPNTIVVIDKDDEGNAYPIAVDNDRLLDFELSKDKTHLEYIAFTHSISTNEDGDEEVRIAVYDEEHYYIFIKDKEGNISQDGTEIAHGIGYCPARLFIREPLNSKAKLNRKAPLAGVLSKIKEWQYFDIYKFYTDHYAPFPVTEMVRNKCNLDDCVDGIVYEVETYFVGTEEKENVKHKNCEICAGLNQVGVGAKIILDPSEEGEPHSAGKFRFISNDVGNLEYLDKKLEKIENYIRNKVVGTDNAITKEAVNEYQIKGSFESKTNILLNIKTNLDELYEWQVKTIGLATVGNKPLEVSANYGTEWYLVSEEELQAKFTKAKEAGLPMEEVELIYLQLIETKYKGNPDKITRLKLINKLNPCPYDTSEGKVSKYEKQIITREELIISERLVTFVNKFEQKNGSINEFGDKLEEDKKIAKIYEQLKTYANEQISNDTSK